MPLGTGFEKIVRLNEPLAKHTWFQLGGAAEYFAEPNHIEELAALVRRCREEEIPMRMLGGGSNLLVRDEGVPGLVARLQSPAFSEIVTRKNTVLAGAGAELGRLVSTSVREGLGGLETLVGIPGSVGGALHVNAGSRGGDIGQWVYHATLMTDCGEIVQRTRDEMVFAYRESSLDELAILSAQFQLEPDDPQSLTKRMQKQWIIKKAGQPLGRQRAGCIFKNPRGMSAELIIEQAGLKGERVGQAEVSQRNANFIIVEQGGTSHDVLTLIELIRRRVEERLGIELDAEIEIW